MAVKKILKIGQHEKLLHTPSDPVKKVNREVKQLIADIRDTIDANPAVGLAAPQIGVLKRVMGVRLGYDEDQVAEDKPTVIMINPEIVEQSEEMENAFDACLSIPNKMGYTDRHSKIRVRYLDETGQTVDRTFTGYDARMIEHEVDHLDGILFLERLNSLEDLYVLGRGPDDKDEWIPYLEAVKGATKSGKRPVRIPRKQLPG